MNNKDYKSRGVTINTDASYYHTTDVGGYAFYIVSDKFRIKQAGTFKGGGKSSTHSELMAIANALHTLTLQDLNGVNRWLVINTDSKNAIGLIVKGKNKSKSVTVVKQLLHKIRQQNKGITIKFKHVRAHTGKDDARSYVNNWCDTNARREARTVHLAKINDKKCSCN